MQAVRIKTEPGEQSGPALPTLPTTDLENEEVQLQAETTEPVLKTENREESHSDLSDLFGDVFVVKVEEGLSVYERLDAEVKSYRNDEFLALEGDPLLWWRGREGKYPLLAKYAKCCLSVPATSVASERVFSTAGDIVTAQRACLSSDNVDKLVFLAKNMIIPDDLQ